MLGSGNECIPNRELLYVLWPLQRAMANAASHSSVVTAMRRLAHMLTIVLTWPVQCVIVLIWPVCDGNEKEKSTVWSTLWAVTIPLSWPELEQALMAPGAGR